MFGKPAVFDINAEARYTKHWEIGSFHFNTHRLLIQSNKQIILTNSISIN